MPEVTTHGEAHSQQIIRTPGFLAPESKPFLDPHTGEVLEQEWYHIPLNPQHLLLRAYALTHNLHAPRFTLLYDNAGTFSVKIEDGEKTSTASLEELGIDPTIPETISLRFQDSIVTMRIPAPSISSGAIPLSKLFS